jgi:chemotaxis protein CheD
VITSERERMSVATVNKKLGAPFVGMGQLVTAAPPEHLVSVLGSCIAVCVYHPRYKVVAMAHVVLPDSQGHTGGPGKFADTAIPALLQAMEQQTMARVGFVAKLAGGASMFGGNGPLQIGATNAAAVKKALEAARVKVVAEHLGGEQGRRVEFDPADGSLSIEIQGQPSIVL